MEKYIKLISKQTRKIKDKLVKDKNGIVVKDENGKDKWTYKEVLLNNVVDFYDHNGRLRHMTEDEIRKMCEHFPKVLEELNKELKK